jgi:hypothetical protein
MHIGKEKYNTEAGIIMQIIWLSSTWFMKKKNIYIYKGAKSS